MRSFLAALALTVFASGCVAPETTGGSGSPSEATSSGSFALSTDSEYDVAGTWEYADVVIQFESHISEEGVATTKLTIDGADFDGSFDYFSQAWEADGHKNTLFRPEIDALAKLEDYLDGAGRKGRPWDRLFSTVAHHAAAPAGFTFLKRSGSPSVKEETQHRESNAVWNDGVNYICRANNTHGSDTGYSGSGAAYSNSWGYNWATHDSLSGEGGDSRNASAGNAYHGAMWTYSPGGCNVGSSYHYADKTGAGVANADYTNHGACEGRCGAGCPRTYNYYFTWDCFDHDVCLDFHPAAPTISYSGDCGYEFSDADGDFASGTSAGYYYDCPGSMGSGCADNGNAFNAGQ